MSDIMVKKSITVNVTGNLRQSLSRAVEQIMDEYPSCFAGDISDDLKRRIRLESMVLRNRVVHNISSINMDELMEPYNRKGRKK